jgi:hypothetical protein
VLAWELGNEPYFNRRRFVIAALRAWPRRFARVIGEPLNAALSSACVMPNRSRARVRASLLPNASRAAYDESLGSS